MFKQNLDWSKIKFIEFYGLRRSGNHAILGWLMTNLNKSRQPIQQLIAPFPEVGYISQRCGSVYQLNDVSSSWSIKNPAYLRGLIDAYGSQGASVIILSYEDIKVQDSFYNLDPEMFFMLKGAQKITVNRRLDNLLASRWKANLTSSKIVEWDLGPRHIDVWKQNLSCPDRILYEDWVRSKHYRDQLASEMNLPNLDLTDHHSPAGGGSSFSCLGEINQQRVLNRYHEIQLPPELQLYLEDPEVTQLLELYWPKK